MHRRRFCKLTDPCDEMLLRKSLKRHCALFTHIVDFLRYPPLYEEEAYRKGICYWWTSLFRCLGDLAAEYQGLSEKLSSSCCGNNTKIHAFEMAYFVPFVRRIHEIVTCDYDFKYLVKEYLQYRAHTFDIPDSPAEWNREDEQEQQHEEDIMVE